MPKDAAADPPDADRDAAAGRPEEVAARESGLSTAATVPAETLPAIQSAALAGGEAAWVSIKAPEKNGLCEDAVAAVPMGPQRGLLLVADGVGGHRGGRTASQLLRKQLCRVARRLNEPPAPPTALLSGVIPVPLLSPPPPNPRDLILDEVERVNQRILRARVGSATTMALVELHGQRVRTYHVGDSEILIVSQRGRVKFASVSHSPIGYAVESGMLTSEEAIFHPDRHLVSNVVGSDQMSVELGRWIALSARDTVLLASDGLFDNLHQEEIIELIRKGPLPEGVERLAQLARRRMLEPLPNQPSKPDDLTVLCYRRSR